MLAEAADMETAAASAHYTAPPAPLERSLGRPRYKRRKEPAHTKESDPKPRCCENCSERKGAQLKKPDQAFRELKQQHVEGVSEDHHMDWIHWDDDTSSWCVRVNMQWQVHIYPYKV